MIYEGYWAQQSCNKFLHFRSKKNDAVFKTREFNNHIIVTGYSFDSLFINNNFIHYDTAYAFILELDNNNNIVFSKYFSLIDYPNSSNYIRCIDALKDGVGNYYVLLHWSGTIMPDGSNSINASTGMMVLKILPNGNVAWTYHIDNVTPTSLCFDKNYDIVILAGTPYSYPQVYVPSNLIIINFNSSNGQIKRTKIGSNAFSKITSGKIHYNQNYFYISCSFKDSIYFNSSQTIKKTGYAAAIVKLDTNFNIVKYATLNAASSQSVSLNDFIVDNNQDVFICGNYKSLNLYVNDTIRLTNSSSLSETMYLVKLNSQLQYQWAKQEIQNPSGNSNYKIRDAYAIATSNNNDVYVLSRLFNSVILGNDTISGTSLLIIQYDKNGNYIQSEKIAGNNTGGVYTLNYLQNANQLIVSATFNSSVSVCQNTLNAGGLDDAYLVWMDKLTFISENTPTSYSCKIYPNPADDKIYVHFNSTIITPVFYTISDVCGKIVVNELLLKDYFINTNHLQPGIYVLTIYNNTDIREQHKLIVRH